MVAKLLWLQQEEPACYSRVHRLCLISDYLTLWFTGHHVTEAGAAGLTGMMDIHHLSWWQKVVEQTGLSLEALPEIHRAGTDLGCIESQIAVDLSLAPTCRFILGCLDQYAGAIGSGNVLPGVVSETTGTVLATVVCTDTVSCARGSNIFVGPAFEEGRYYQMVFGEVSASLLEAYRSRLPHHPDFTALVLAAAQTMPKATLPESEDSQLLLNWIYKNIQNYTEGEITRAILERVAVALKQQVTTLCGIPFPDQIFCVGGAARSKFWLQLKANLLDRPAVPIDCPEPTSLGAFLLALHALSGNSLEELAKTLIPYGSPIPPNPSS